MTTHTSLRIRRYQPGDHPTVVALNAYGLAAVGVPSDADVYAGDLENIEHTYLTGRATLLVGELRGTVVAMGALHPVNTTTCEITRMRVHPDAQGHGYGKQILHALEDHARELGYHQAVLLTGLDQHPAVDLYQTAGYATIAVEHHGDLAGIRMHKDLADHADALPWVG